MRARAVLSLIAILIVALCANATQFVGEKFTKQVGGGSTGDSLTATPDTSDSVLLKNLFADEWFVWVMADSQTIYTTQVSADSSNWYTIDRDTVTAGEAENSVYFDTGLIDTLFVRVIMDPIPGACPYGAAFVTGRRGR